MNSQIKNKAVYWGTGRRKTSVARVRLIPGNGLIKINGRAGDDYLKFNPLHLNSIKAPLQTLGLENSYDILVNVFGGGLLVKQMLSSKEQLEHFANYLLTIGNL